MSTASEEELLLDERHSDSDSFCSDVASEVSQDELSMASLMLTCEDLTPESAAADPTRVLEVYTPQFLSQIVEQMSFERNFVEPDSLCKGNIPGYTLEPESAQGVAALAFLEQALAEERELSDAASLSARSSRSRVSSVSATPRKRGATRYKPLLQRTKSVNTRTPTLSRRTSVVSVKKAPTKRRASKAALKPPVSTPLAGHFETSLLAKSSKAIKAHRERANAKQVRSKDLEIHRLERAKQDEDVSRRRKMFKHIMSELELAESDETEQSTAAAKRRARISARTAKKASEDFFQHYHAPAAKEQNGRSRVLSFQGSRLLPRNSFKAANGDTRPSVAYSVPETRKRSKTTARSRKRRHTVQPSPSLSKPSARTTLTVPKLSEHEAVDVATVQPPIGDTMSCATGVDLYETSSQLETSVVSSTSSSAYLDLDMDGDDDERIRRHSIARRHRASAVPGKKLIKRGKQRATIPARKLGSLSRVEAEKLSATLDATQLTRTEFVNLCEATNVVSLDTPRTRENGKSEASVTTATEMTLSPRSIQATESAAPWKTSKSTKETPVSLLESPVSQVTPLDSHVGEQNLRIEQMAQQGTWGRVSPSSKRRSIPSHVRHSRDLGEGAALQRVRVPSVVAPGSTARDSKVRVAEMHLQRQKALQRATTRPRGYFQKKRLQPVVLTEHSQSTLHRILRSGRRTDASSQ
ncbi:MAG: hypothetical protein MHM6MM_001037 [Cercozoa sp. M6MM]